MSAPTRDEFLAAASRPPSTESAHQGPQLADAIAAQLRGAPRQLSPRTAAEIGDLIGPLLTATQAAEPPTAA